MCKSKAAQLKRLGNKDFKCDFNYQNIDSKKLQEYKLENHVLFKTIEKLNRCLTDENNKSTECIQQSINELKQEFDFEKDFVNTVSKNERLIRSLTDIVSENNVWKPNIKVTEINMSSDLFVKEVEHRMTLYKLILTKVDYQLIVGSMEDSNEKIKATVSLWETHEELKLKASDLIILRDCHQIWELSLKKILLKISESLIGNGFVIIVLKSRLTEPEIALNSLLKTKNNINNSDLEKRIEEIIDTSKEVGLNIVCKKFDTIGTMALLFRKIEDKKIPDNNQIIEITEQTNETWFESLKEKLISNNEKENEQDNIWLIASDSNINGILGLINCLALETGGEKLRCIFDLDHKITLPIDWNSKPFSDILSNDLVINVIKEGKLGTYRHLSLPKDYDKTVSSDYYLNMGPNNDLSSLQWFDAKNIVANTEFYGINNNKQTLIPINVYSSGLTFHDVMIALGRIPSRSLLLYTDCVIGWEFAGRRADTGERIFGIETGRAYSTSVNANPILITTIPEHWSMEDGLTILSPYITVWHGLIERASIRKGESILIHSGAGGVGQSAINVCKHYECDIFVTVGTEEKKQFLIKEYNIPENRIFSSRDIQFKYRIKELTKGKGVDIVLNSLSGEKLDASYECLANGGRFVELGKLDLSQNKQLGMFDFLRYISFIGVSVDLIIMQNPNYLSRFFDWMHKNSTNGCIKPLNKTVFNANEVEKAFRHMTTGKHIGKIVIRIREEEVFKRPMKYIKEAQKMLVTNKTFFDPNKVHILIGGLGGFAMELIHWMTYMGARKFILTSRSGIKTGYQKFIINRLIKFGEVVKYFNVKIEISVNDCYTPESTRRVITDASQLGQIGSVFQLSMVLNDTLFESLTFDKFRETVDPKYKVFNNLDVESRKLGYNLDYFVLISTIACGKGNAYQSNYGYGSALCERICEQRRKDGLHGLAIQYGPITDVSVYEARDKAMDLMTSHQLQRINSCCDVLDKLLAVKQPIVTSFLKSERLVQRGSAQNSVLREFWKSMGIDPTNTPDHLTLEEIGLESIFAIELQQVLQGGCNIKLALNQTKSLTVGILKKFEAGKPEEVVKFVDEFQWTRRVLQKFRFIIPTDVYTPLNNVKTGKPIYFLPPLEISFGGFEELAQKFDRPVIGLNWTKDINNFNNLDEIYGYYSQLLNSLEPNGKYDLAGCLDGAIVISKLYMEGRINKSVVFDFISNKEFKDEVLSDDYFVNVFLYFLAHLPSVVVDKIRRLMAREPDIKSKIQVMVSHMKGMFGRGLVATDMEEIFQILVKRIQMTFEYTLQTKQRMSTKLKEGLIKMWAQKTGQLVVIKGFKFSEVQQMDGQDDDEKRLIRDTYLLPKNDGITIEGLDIADTFAVTNELVVNKLIEIFN